MNLTKKFKWLRKSNLICCLSIIGGCNFLMGNSAYNKKNNENYHISFGNEIKTKANQQLWFHGNGLDYDLSETRRKDVFFKQTFKNVYLSNVDKTPLLAKKMINTIKQETAFDENHCSGSYFNENHDYEIDSRVQNWKEWYQDDLYIGEIENLEKKWGTVEGKIFLKNNNLWEQKTEHHEIKNQIIYGLENGYPKIYDTGKDLELQAGFKKELWNQNFLIYGIRKSFLKENPHVAVFYNWVNRYYWTLHGENTISNFSEVEVVGQKPIVNLFSLDNVLELTNASWENKTIDICWSHLLNDQQKTTLDIIGNETNYILEYTSYSQSNPDKEERIEVNLDQNKISKKLKLNLNPNKEGNYLIKNLRLKINETVNEKNYIQESVGNSFIVNDPNIDQMNGCFQLKKNQIQDFMFVNMDYSYAKFFVSQISNQEILKRHVVLIDSYKNEISGENLKDSEYEIFRDGEAGEIKITIRLNQSKSIKLKGFIKNQLGDIEINVENLINHEIADEVDREKVNCFLKENGFQENFIKRLNISLKNKNNESGWISFIGNDVTNQNYCFRFINLKKYFCKQNNEKHDLLPSEVDEKIVFEKFINCSEEFILRNEKNWKVHLFKNDKEGKLKINLITDNENYEFNFNNLRSSKENSIWLIIGGSVCVIIAVLMLVYFLRNRFSINNHKLYS